MSRDWFHQQIVERLARPLDRDLFEECAADILRADFSTLVPICGGQDAGMDGAIADGQGAPLPLISTTAVDVLDNLRKSLKSYRDKPGARDSAVLATSQELTQKRRQNLEAEAKKFGVTLFQIYTRSAIAHRLYREPRWCRALLGLTGDPPALSSVPVSSRPLVGDRLVGRQEDLEWLRQTDGDRILVGQPGSGKTFVLHRFAQEANGLFLVSNDMGRVAEAIRQDQPAVIMVDDAHSNLELLSKLRHIRTELEADFHILAACWPSERNSVQHRLEQPSSQVHELPLLTRDEIVEVVKLAGVEHPTQLVREIVNQAEGRPGLAVTLTRLCLQGDVRDVVLGDALKREVYGAFGRRLGSETVDCLAAFAIGGDSGMSWEEVANLLGKPPIDVRSALINLADGGLIRDVREGFVSIRPEILRHALLRDVFFHGPAPLSIGPFLQAVPDITESARTLIGASRIDADVPDDMLLTTLKRVDSVKAWEEYAWLGRRESENVLNERRDLVIELAHPLLWHAPERVLPVLLDKAIGDKRPLHSTVHHPLRSIQDWIKNVHPSRALSIPRRRVLLEAVQKWLASGRDRDVGAEALAIAFYPAFQCHEIDAGAGMTWTLTSGTLPLDQLEQVFTMWVTACECLHLYPPENWSPICTLVQSWIYPGANGPFSPPTETYNRMIEIAQEMLKDVIAIAHEHQGVLYWAREIAHNLHLDLEIPLEADVQVLFPFEGYDHENRDSLRRAQGAQVRRLADSWSSQDPAETAARLIRIRGEMKSVPHVWPDYLSTLCDELAQRVASPTRWARQMVDIGCTPDLVFPFLAHAMRQRETGYEELLRNQLASQEHRLGAALVILRTEQPPTVLLDRALDSISGAEKHIHTECMCGRVPEFNVLQLLRHADSKIAGAAAIGEWQAEPRERVRNTLHNDWRAAIIRETCHTYELRKILRADSELAEEWLMARLDDESDKLYINADVVDAAVAALNIAARRRVLSSLPESHVIGRLVKALVEENLELYELLLDNPRLRAFHLYPLEGLGGETWIRMAKMALDCGYPHASVVGAGFTCTEVWSGKESQKYQWWIDRFQRLCAHEDCDIRRIGEEGLKIAKARQDWALQRERNEEIYGFD